MVEDFAVRDWAERLEGYHIDVKIMFMLEKALFESVHSIAHVRNMDHTIGLNQLQEKLGLMGTAPVDRRTEGKSQGIWSTDGSLPRSGEPRRLETFCDRQRVLILPFIWPLAVWAPAKDEVATKARTDIQNKEFMLIVMWNLHGFHVIERLPTSSKRHSVHYTTSVLQTLYQVFLPRRRTPRGKRLVVDADN
jgi:hypothetical protein